MYGCWFIAICNCARNCCGSGFACSRVLISSDWRGTRELLLEEKGSGQNCKPQCNWGHCYLQAWALGLCRLYGFLYLFIFLCTMWFGFLCATCEFLVSDLGFSAVSSLDSILGKEFSFMRLHSFSGEIMLYIYSFATFKL